MADGSPTKPNDSGRFEIYVRPFPDVARGLWQVSTDGGTRPLWARNGQELFYLTPTGALMRVGVAARADVGGDRTDEAVRGTLRPPSSLPFRPDIRRLGRWQAVPDDQRQRSRSDPNATPASMVVVLNWTEELKRLVPRR